MTDLFAALAHRMNHVVARQSVIAGNIANANTPGYLAKDLTFKPQGSGGGSFAMHVTNARHLAGRGGSGNAAGKMVEDTRFIQHNGNSVRLDMEMVKQNEAALDYRMMTQLYTSNLQLRRTAIGRGQ